MVSRSASSAATRTPAKRKTVRKDLYEFDEGSDYVEDGSDENAAPTKGKRKAQKGAPDSEKEVKKNKAKVLALSTDILKPGETSLRPVLPPLRRHAASYHRPLLLVDSDTSSTGRTGRDALLQWFDRISTERKMPWRKRWIDPAEYVGREPVLEEELKKRAYEVWISEIMLQQTRVLTVIDYWNRWMARWPTIHDLAQASPEDVLSAWRGLGYYSRASRIHAAAKKMVDDPKRKGMLPSRVEDLQKEVPGVGRYTAGAISSIVFGQPAPMLDGNVIRVLSRQLGIYADTKSSKHVIDSLWTAAEQLVQTVASDVAANGTEKATASTSSSDRPGRWGQALMELGSTICTPRPSCAQCPIRASCRAYGEGEALAIRQGAMPQTQTIHRHTTDDIPNTSVDVGDIEDLCKICEPLEVVECDATVENEFDEEVEREELGEEEQNKGSVLTNGSNGSTHRIINGSSNKAKKGNKQMSLSSFSFTTSIKKATKVVVNDGQGEGHSVSKAPNRRALDIIEAHVRNFPMRVAKKVIRQEEAIVVALRRRRQHPETSGWEWKLHQRPAKGLLADMWEMPSKTIEEPESAARTATQRKKLALAFIDELGQEADDAKLKGEMGSVPWVFSHLKLTMHVFLVELKGSEEGGKSPEKREKWSSTAQVEDENMGTGMKHCWALVKDVK